MSDQLATRAVDVLATIRAIAPSGEHPMRHTARALKQEAENVLSEAFTRAQNLVFLADQVIRDYDRAIEVKDAPC